MYALTGAYASPAFWRDSYSVPRLVSRRPAAYSIRCRDLAFACRRAAVQRRTW